MRRLVCGFIFVFFLGIGMATAQSWPDFHLTNGIHNTSYGVEIYDPLYPKNLYIDPVAVLKAGSTELDDIHNANQVYHQTGEETKTILCG